MSHSHVFSILNVIRFDVLYVGVNSTQKRCVYDLSIHLTSTRCTFPVMQFHKWHRYSALHFVCVCEHLISMDWCCTLLFLFSFFALKELFLWWEQKKEKKKCESHSTHFLFCVCYSFVHRFNFHWRKSSFFLRLFSSFHLGVQATTSRNSIRPVAHWKSSISITV